MKKIVIKNPKNPLVEANWTFIVNNENEVAYRESWGKQERWVREAYLVSGIENEESFLFYPDETYEESDVLDRREREIVFHTAMNDLVSGTVEDDCLEIIKEVLLTAEYTIEIEDITESFGKSNCKKVAKELIRDLDWVIDEETLPKLLNKSEFINYRSVLRSLIINPQTEPSWPVRPQEVWE